MEVSAYAKLNLTFEVLGRRNDGFHQVTTIMQTIGLADMLWIEPDSELKVECEYPELAGEQNLVWQAAVALAKAGNIEPTARIPSRSTSRWPWAWEGEAATPRGRYWA